MLRAKLSLLHSFVHYVYSRLLMPTDSNVNLQQSPVDN